MIKVNEIAFVAYPVKDKQKARDFYEGVLNLKLESSGDFPDGFWIEYEIGRGTLALSNFWKPAAEPAMGPSVGLEVEDFEGTVAELKRRGVPFSTEPMETPVCHLAVVGDPDGNSLFIHRRKPGHEPIPF
jgi:catechol 2,3-dioxygenase-like lactoylglutathione lyase family enzyme